MSIAKYIHKQDNNRTFETFYNRNKNWRMFMGEFYSNISKRLIAYRNLMNLTQAQMGEKLGVSQSHYSKLEAGLKNVSYNNLKCFEKNGGDIYHLITGQKILCGKVESYLSRCHTPYGQERIFEFLILITEMGIQLVSEKHFQLTERTFKSAKMMRDFNEELTIWENIRRAESFSQIKMAEIFDINVKRYRSMEKEKTKPNAEILHALYYKLQYSPLIVLDKRMYYMDEMNRAWDMFPESIVSRLESIAEVTLKFIQDYEGQIKDETCVDT